MGTWEDRAILKGNMDPSLTPKKLLPNNSAKRYPFRTANSKNQLSATGTVVARLTKWTDNSSVSYDQGRRQGGPGVTVTPLLQAFFNQIT